MLLKAAKHQSTESGKDEGKKVRIK